MSIVAVYMTARDMEEAERIGRMVVEARLAACVNIMGGVRSLYWWDGTLHAESECVMIAKTRSGMVERLIDAVKAAHSYDVPAISVWPVLEGNPDFLDWVDAETRDEALEE